MFTRHSQILAFMLHRRDAKESSPLPWLGIPSLRHHQLLPAAGPSWHAPVAPSLPRSDGANRQAPSLCRRRLRGHAGACPSSLQGTGAVRPPLCWLRSKQGGIISIEGAPSLRSWQGRLRFCRKRFSVQPKPVPRGPHPAHPHRMVQTHSRWCKGGAAPRRYQGNPPDVTLSG